MNRLPLYLLLLILPLAVAGQNIGTSVVAVILFGQLYLRRADLRWAEVWASHKVPLVLSGAFVATLVVSTLLNPANPSSGWGALAIGHAIWALLPLIACVAQGRLTDSDWRRLFLGLALVVLVMGGVAVSQYLFGWRLSGASIVDAPARARGFYSHPLTFAYVGLLVFPLGCAAVAKMPANPAAWACFSGAVAVVYTSESRTVQAICALVLVANLVYVAKGRARTLLCALAAATVLAFAVTDNPMKRKFAETIGGGHDVRSGYRDDRLAFWDANWQMVKERPLLGHGDHLNTAYRAPYYERIGLAGFERMYEAHNMYLQVAVNAGMIGLALFLAWYGWHLRAAMRLGRASFGGKVAFQTLVALAAAAMTQNAFQDSEVRFALTLLVVALWLANLSASEARPRPR